MLEAAGDPEYSPDQLEGFAHGFGIGIRPEVFIFLPGLHPEFAHVEHSGPLIAECDRDIGVALIVPQADVVGGVMLFDEVGFENERLEFGIGDDSLDIGDLIHHPAFAPREIRSLLEIRPHPVFQDFALPTYMICPPAFFIR